MSKSIHINLIVYLLFVLVIFDFYNLSKYKNTLENCKEITDKCLFENKNPNEFLPQNTKYTCSTNCNYESGKIVEYKISIKTSFFINPFQKEFDQTYYYLISEVKFY